MQRPRETAQAALCELHIMDMRTLGSESLDPRMSCPDVHRWSVVLGHDCVGFSAGSVKRYKQLEAIYLSELLLSLKACVWSTSS